MDNSKPAFPMPGTFDPNGYIATFPEFGMTLRQHRATAFVAAIVSTDLTLNGQHKDQPATVCKMALHLADKLAEMEAEDAKD